MVLQTLLPEFCNQTSHPAHSPLGQGARLLPVNKSDCSGKNTAATSWPPAPGTAGPHSSSTGLGRGHRRGRQAGRHRAPQRAAPSYRDLTWKASGKRTGSLLPGPGAALHRAGADWKTG